MQRGLIVQSDSDVSLTFVLKDPQQMIVLLLLNQEAYERTWSTPPFICQTRFNEFFTITGKLVLRLLVSIRYLICFKIQTRR